MFVPFWYFFQSMEKSAWDGPKWVPRGLFPANPDLADILGRTDLSFEKFDFLELSDPKFLDFQVPRSSNPRFPGSQIYRRRRRRRTQRDSQIPT